MNTCLMISGLPRCVERGYENIFKSLIEPNNPDIFIHTWNLNENDDLYKKINNLYKPKIFVSEKQKIFKNTHINLDRMMISHGRSYKLENFVEMIYSSWYSVLQSNLLKEQYKLENNINYDYAIRARFDITYTSKIECYKYDKNIIHVANRPDLPAEMIDDRFALGSDSLMNVYCSNFNFINYIYEIRDKKDGIFCGETIVYELSKMTGIQYKKIDHLNCNHLNHVYI